MLMILDFALKIVTKLCLLMLYMSFLKTKTFTHFFKTSNDKLGRVDNWLIANKLSVNLCY